MIHARLLLLSFIALGLASCATPPKNQAGTSLIGIVERVNGAPLPLTWVTLMMKTKPGFLSSSPASESVLEIVQTNARGIFVFSVSPENAGNDFYIVVHGRAQVRGRPPGKGSVELGDVVENAPRFDTLNVIAVPEEFVSLPRPGPALSP